MRLRTDALTGGDGQTRTDHFTTTPTAPPGQRKRPTGFAGPATSKASAATWSRRRTTRPAPRCALPTSTATSSRPRASASATGPAATIDADEFGVPRHPATARYGWLGGKERATKLEQGLIQMGVRSYLPQPRPLPPSRPSRRRQRQRLRLRQPRPRQHLRPRWRVHRLCDDRPSGWRSTACHAGGWGCHCGDRLCSFTFRGESTHT